MNKGINALDLIESGPVKPETFTKARGVLEASFGKDYSDMKMAVLFDLIRDDGWSEERFTRTLKWFLMNVPFPEWSVANWFNYRIKVYPYSWYLQQCSPGTNVSTKMDIYRLANGTVVYRWKDGQELPFEKL